MARVEQIDDRQWRSATGLSWPDGAPLTVASLFDYQYRGQSHYAGHAEEIERLQAPGNGAEDGPSSR